MQFCILPLICRMQTYIIVTDVQETNGRQPPVAKLELLALYVFRGGVAERPQTLGLHPADAAQSGIRGWNPSPTARTATAPRQRRQSPLGQEPHSQSSTGSTTPVSGFRLWNSTRDFTVTCRNRRTEWRRYGKDRKGNQRSRCLQCCN